MQPQLLSDHDRTKFYDYCRTKQLDQIEEVDITVDQAWAVGDRAAAADGPYPKNVLSGTSGNLVVRTQDPPMGLGNKLPGDSAIFMYAVGAVVRLGSYSTTANKIATQADLDRSKLEIKQGGARVAELVGPRFMDYGPSMLGGYDGAAAPGFQPTMPRIICPLKAPRILGAEQVLDVKHYVDRISDWGAAFTISYCFLALIGRKR